MSVINTNVKALTAQASLSSVNKTMSTAMERLSTGSRINSAKDDAAGMAITLRMTSDIRGFAVAIRNANDGISMAQTAEGGLGQINDMLQRMRELAVQSSNSSASPDNRAASQLEVTQLKQEIDSIASRTNFNSIKLLDGTASKLTLQTGVNAGDTMTMKIDSASTKDIGVGARSSLTATGSFNASAGSLATNLAAGDLVVNGVTVGASLAASDLLSSGDKSASAIAKVAAINLVSAQSGVTATVGSTTVAGTAFVAAAAASGTITVNGVATSAFAVTADAGVSRANSVAAINAISAQTGVKAIDTGDINKGVVLEAADGRNITIAIGTHTAASTGVGTIGVHSGTYQLASSSGDPISISTSSSGTLANAGLSAGTYTANVSGVTSVVRAAASSLATVASASGVLLGGTLTINGTAIDAAVAASDTASDIIAVSSTKAASGIAIAAAINAKTGTTGVTAKAEANVIVGTADFSATALAAQKLWVNGVSIVVTTTATSTRGDVAAIINNYSGQTGVVASDNGKALTLTAADGRNISIASESGTAANFGILAGAMTAAGADNTTGKTTYAKVSLSSDKSFTLAGGSEGNANFALLGFKTGTVGGKENGVKVADVDVSTISGAQTAITALDSALKSVSLGQAKLGAYQNRLDAAVSNLTVANLNMSASRSRIQDTDYATESTNLAKSQIISQAATAMLAQANQSAQGVLALLK
ncbi:MAG: flagellin [Polaromonas sp.]|nr:flagellin [Polaromonas sp.]